MIPTPSGELAGSPVLLSFFLRSGNPRYDLLACRVANFIRRLLGSRREGVEVGDHLNWSYSHWFTREEIEGELQEAEFGWSGSMKRMAMQWGGGVIRWHRT